MPPAPLEWPQEDPILDSEEVGYLPGGGAITAAGDYSYSLPVEVPPGRGGMEPHIGLRYSSRGGTGSLGKGWSLEYGESEIRRCPKTFAIDGETAAVSFDGGGALCLDGQRLLHVAGPGMMHEGAEYRTERDSFVKVVAHGQDPIGPDWFEVFEKGGIVRKYTALDARRVTAPTVAKNTYATPPVGPAEVVRPVWVISEERDRNGNVVLFDYDVESGEEAPYSFEHRIRAIRYTGRKNEAGALVEAPRREVRFEYSAAGERPDVVFQYENGIRRTVTRRLTGIELRAPNPVETDKVGRYRLIYDVGAEGAAKNPRSLLAAVERSDAKGRRLWQRNFEWEHAAGVTFDAFDVDSYSSAGILGKPLLLDVDNDGKDEMIYAGRLYRTTKGSLAPLNEWVLGGDMLGRPADVDGDGKMEVLRAIGGQKVFVKWHAATETFEPTSYVFPNRPLDFVDADGDGRIDAFQVGPRVNPNVDYYDEEWYFLRNTSGGFADPIPSTVAMQYRPEARVPAALDLNGDGRGELHVDYTPSDETPLPRRCPPVPNNDWHFYSLELNGNKLQRNALHAERCPQSHVLADINGDGLKDILVIGEDVSTVRYNAGTGFLAETSLDFRVATNAGTHDFLVADVDGDGREDLLSSHEIDVATGAPLPDSYLYLPHVGGFEEVNLGQEPYNVPAYDPYPEGSEPPAGLQNHSPVIQPADVNGDGLTDLVILERDVPADKITIRALVQKWQPGDVVVRVRDQGASGPRESVFYDAFPTDSPSASKCVYPSRCIRRGMLTAREHWIHRQDEPAAIRRTAYEFDDPRTDLRGRGFLGFGKVRRIDLDSHAETTMLFDHATIDDKGRYPFASLPRETWEITPILFTLPDASGGVVLPGAGTPLLARVRVSHVDYEVKLTNGERTYFVTAKSTQTGDWEQHVTLGDGGLTLVADGSETAHRVRETTHTHDDYDNETQVTTKTLGGQRCEVTTTFDNLTADWQIGLRRRTESACNQDGLPLPEKRVTATDYDARGLVWKVTVEPEHPELSLVTTYTRNIYGQAWKIVSKAFEEPSRTLHIAYDEEEHLAPRATCNALDQCDQQLLHPAYGVPIVAQDKNGIQAHFTYDGFGRSRGVTPDDGVSSVLHYHENEVTHFGLVTTTSTNDGGESLVISDDWGRTIRATHRGFDGAWIHDRVDYNLFGKATRSYRPSVGEPPSAVTVSTYDTLGRLLEIEEPNGAVATVAHTMFESVTTDPEGRKSRVTRDIDDRVAETAHLYDGSWVATTYHYGPNNQVEDIVDPESNVVHAMYDKIGRRVLLDDPDRGTTSWTHNGFGEVTSELDALGDTTTYQRDVLGRMIASLHDEEGLTVFAYDGDNEPGERGRLTYTKSPDGVEVEYAYNALGQNRATEWHVDGSSYEIRRSFDGLGRLEGIQYPEIPNHGQLRLKYDYNARGYMSAVRDFTDPGTPKLLWQVDARNAEGLLENSTSGNDVTEGRTYDPLTGQLVDVEAVRAGEALFSVHYTRDLTGNIRARDDHSKGIKRAESFDYDDLDRLSRWTVRIDSNDEPTDYTYDLLGNLEAITTSAGTETHHHDGEILNGVPRLPHALTGRTRAGQSESFAYDDRGRQIVGGGRKITWKPFDLPSTIEQDGQTTTLSYDALGTRIRKVRYDSEGGEGGDELGGTDTIGGLYERRRNTGSATEHVWIVHGTDGPVAQIVYTEAPNDPGRTLYLHREALGSVGLVTDNHGGEVERTYFDPFGGTVDAYGAAIAPDLGEVKIGFTGHRHDDELGLINMGGRIYDPSQKRFLSPDPHVTDPMFGQSYNRYSYVVNNPLRYVDPTGFNNVTPQVTTGIAGQSINGQDAGGVIQIQEDLILGRVTPEPQKSDEAGHKEAVPQESTITITVEEGTDEGRKADNKRSAFDFLTHMAKGAALEMLGRVPPVAAAKQIGHNVRVVGAAISHLIDGDTDLAANAIAELPQQNAEAAASFVTGPIHAATEGWDAAKVVLNSDADPEKRGAAAVVAAADIATVAVAVVGVAGSARARAAAAESEGGAAKGGPKTGSAEPAGAGKPFPQSVKERARTESGEKCVFCGTKTGNAPGPTKSEIDHAIPRSRGGDNTIDNAQNTCRTCNRAKGARTSEEFF